MGKNKNCPSYDYGECNTFPAPYAVQCGGEETKNCKWLNFDFIGAKYENPEQSNEIKLGQIGFIYDAKGKIIKNPKFYLIQHAKTKKFVRYPLSSVGANITRRALLTKEVVEDIFCQKEKINRVCKDCPYGRNADYQCYAYDSEQQHGFCVARYDKKTELDVYEIELRIKKVDSTQFQPNSFKKWSKENGK